MGDGSSHDITAILRGWSAGDERARESLLPLVYDELRRQARRIMSAERNDHTLQPTALVHETFLRLSSNVGVAFEDRRHFFGIASRLMREILIDHARRHASLKRGGNSIRFSLDDLNLPVVERAASLLALDDALTRLQQVNERQAVIVEMRFFGGMSNDEIAEALQISERTVRRSWESARLWLYRELNS